LCSFCGELEYAENITLDCSEALGWRVHVTFNKRLKYLEEISFRKITNRNNIFFVKDMENNYFKWVGNEKGTWLKCKQLQEEIAFSYSFPSVHELG
jgi:hypothetical protein